MDPSVQGLQDGAIEASNVVPELRVLVNVCREGLINWVVTYYIWVGCKTGSNLLPIVYKCILERVCHILIIDSLKETCSLRTKIVVNKVSLLALVNNRIAFLVHG